MIPGRYKDYISTPKQNDYRSHPYHGDRARHASASSCRSAPWRWRKWRNTALPRTPSTRRASTTIRASPTRAAPINGCDAPSIYWPKATIRRSFSSTRSSSFSTIRSSASPRRARLIALPRGATPIDFAYAVHTDVGNTAVGCKINGRMSPLLTELQNGDEVEIIRAEGQTPPAAWESLVVTGKARASIRRATRAAVRRQYTGLGHADSGARLRARQPVPSRTRSSKRPCPGWPASPSKTCWRQSGAARCSRATWFARSIPITRKIAGPARRTDRRQGRRRATAEWVGRDRHRRHSDSRP